MLGGAAGVWGHVDEAWLRAAVGRFGPLTHHIQLRAAILADALRGNGIAIDRARRAEKLAQVEAILAERRERLRRRGYLAGQRGSERALQSILAQFRRDHPGVELRPTESGGRYSTAEEDLAELARLDPFFRDLATYRAAEKLASTYLSKMGRPRLHPRFAPLLATGRMSCGGGLNLQGLPGEADEAGVTRTIRGCFVPSEGHVFIDADYAQIELVVLAHAIRHQLGRASRLAEIINAGQDVHRLIASLLLGKPAGAVTRSERQGIKPVSFGRPGGMGAATLRQVARAGYGIELTLEEVGRRIAAYHRACPELDDFLADEVDAGAVLARQLGLTPAAYRRAVGQAWRAPLPEDDVPQAWLGRMLLKALGEEAPRTGRAPSRPYRPEELDYFWGAARRLPAGLREKLMARQADPRLRQAVGHWAGRRPVFTLTGRLRAGATFCAARNTIFQAWPRMGRSSACGTCGGPATGSSTSSTTRRSSRSARTIAWRGAGRKWSS